MKFSLTVLAPGLVALMGAVTLLLPSHDSRNPERTNAERLSIETERVWTEPPFSNELRLADDASTSTTLLFLGDIMLDRHVADRISEAHDPAYPFQAVTSSWAWQNADAIIANLEGPASAMRRPPVKSIDFLFATSVAPLLRDLGITAVSQANNHTLDQGRIGADESRKWLTEAGLAVFGHQTQMGEATSTAIIERKGKKIALIGFNTTDGGLDLTKAEKIMETAQGHADFTIIIMHWGDEYHAKPNAAQVALAHWLIDHGATAVIGAHPHWMESVEIYRGQPIAYSLGNFIFDQDFSAETKYGLAVGLTLAPSSTTMTLYPIHIEKSQPRLLAGAEREQRLERLADISEESLREKILEGAISP